MQQSSVKIIVKVGKKSDILFHGVQTFRAITLDEMIKLTELHPDASIIVIENIKSTDVQRATDFIREFEARNENNHVYFYTPDNDLETGGIADELEKESYLSKNTLYSAIENTSKVVVTTDISRLREASTDLNDPFDAMWVIPSDGLDGISDKIEDKQDSSSDNLGDGEHIASKDADGHTDEEIRSAANADIQEIKQPEESKIDTNKTDDGISNADIEEVGTRDSREEKSDTSKLDKKQETEDKTDATLNKTPINSDEQSELLTKAIGELRDTTSKLTEAKGEIDKLRGELAVTIAKNKNLTELIGAVESERDTFQSRLKLYGKSEVMEEPITLAEYSELQNKVKSLSESSNSGATPEQIEEFNAKIKKAEESANIARKNLDDYKSKLREASASLSDVQNKLDTKQSEIDAKQAEISRLEGEVEKLKGELQTRDQLQQQSIFQSELTITELKSNIGKLEAEIDQLKNSVIAESQKSAVIQNQLTEANKYSDQLKSRIDREVKARLIVVGILADAVREIQSQISAAGSNTAVVDSLNESIRKLEQQNSDNMQKIAEYEQKMITLASSEATIKSLQLEKDRLISESSAKQAEIIKLNATITSNQSKIAEMERQLGRVGSDIEFAKSQLKIELEAAKREANEAKQSLTLMQQQLKEKSDQYEALVQSSGMSETGVSSLLETNKIREEYNKQLITEVDKLRTQLETAQREAAVSKQTVTALEQSNKSMRENLESMSNLIGNKGVSGQTLKPIKYTSRGLVIPVFGSGGYGTTTTAMSLANRLSAQARVLYIDFDMVFPKADGWFRKNPIITNLPGTESMKPPTSRTGLGILIEKQIQYFMTNFEQIIIHASMTKSGCIDYLSGLLVRPDQNKLLGTDWSAFMNFCGNRYTYIILDMGRLGSSDVSDQIIKGMVMSAYKSILVSTSDRYEVSQLTMKMSKLGIDKSRIAWLINMCKNTKMDEGLKKQINPAQYFMMMFNPDIYGMKLMFVNDNLLRDKFFLFLDEIVFPKKGQGQ